MTKAHKRYLRRMFQGETGDIVKQLLTDGQWKPPKKKPKKPDTIAVKIVGIILYIILMGAVGFGVWEFLS